MLYPPAETHIEPSQTSRIDLFARIVKGFKLALVTIFAKIFIPDVYRGPEYAHDLI